MNEKLYPLSHSQKRIWHLEKIHPGTGMFNNAGTLKIKGRIDVELMQQAVNIFLAHSDAMRIRITAVNGEPKQYINDYKPVVIDVIDFSHDNIEVLYAWDNHRTKINMPLIDCDLYEFAILLIGPNEAGFFAKVHHIITDGWSMVMFASRLMEVYSALLGNDPLPEYFYGEYTDYITKEQQYLQSQRFINDRNYWLGKFSELPELTTLKQKVENYNSIKSRRKAFVVPLKESQVIRNYCETKNVSVFAFFLAVVLIYCKRILNKRDIVLGVPVFNRTNFNERNTIGMFVSTVPFRITVDDKMNFNEFVNHVTNEWLSVLKHQKYPYDLLIHELRQQHKGLDTLYDIALSYQNAQFSKDNLNIKYEGRWHFSEMQANSLSIHLNDRESEGNFIIDYDHHIPFYSIKEIQYIHDHVLNIIRDVLSDDHQKLHEINFIPQEEKQRILFDFNNNERLYPYDETLDELFVRQVKSTPDAIALIAGQDVLTYAELDGLVTKQAAHLQALGVVNNDIVGVLVERNYRLLVAILGILRAGAAFLPIDPDFPVDRINYELTESHAKAVVTTHLLQHLCKAEIIIFNVDHLNDLPTLPLSAIYNDPHDLAYVIYTSGSTGQPKGVMIEQHSIVHFLCVLADIMDFSLGNFVMSAATIAFDLFIMETFPTLFNGGTVVLANEFEVNIPKNMVRLIELTRINKIMTTPSRFQLFLSGEGADRCLKNVKEIMTGGDALSDKLLATLQSMTTAKIFNFYGPTEITIAATCKELTHEKNVNIGKPLFNMQAYILDEHLNPVPIGTHGELYIGGRGLARGYLNQPELTATRFISNPFIPGQMIYKTGDLCRWYPRGDIEYLGRIDHQVKIRGFRIELGEIESKILEIPGVDACAVIDQTDHNQRKFLCAYVVGKDLPKINHLKTELSKMLPIYMIPSYFIEVAEIPLTISGKLDKHRLPSIETQLSVSSYEAPETPTEIVLAEIWSKILNLQIIDRYDSFFDIGGDSLSVIDVANHIQQLFNIDISLEEVYRTPSLIDVAAMIDNSTTINQNHRIESINQQFYPVSSSQMRMYLVSWQSGELTSVYNMPVAYQTKDKINAKLLQRSLNRLIQRHEILRTTFSVRKNQLVQKVSSKATFKLQEIALDSTQLKAYIRNFIRPFDFTQPPLLRAVLIHVDAAYDVLVIDMHHIVADGTSAVILLNELNLLYQGDKLPNRQLQYKDYAVWNQYQKDQLNYNRAKAFWANYLSGDLNPLLIPTDYPRKSAQSTRGNSIQTTIPNDLTSRLRIYAQKHGLTMYMLLLAAYNLLLAKYTLADDIIVGSPVSGRTNYEIRDMVGVFINMLPMRNHPTGELSAEQFIQHVKSNCIQAYEYQNYPFDNMISDLKIHRETGRNPIFDTMFIYNTFDTDEIKLGNISLTPYKLKTSTAKLDITLEVFDNNAILKAQFEYATELFKATTIRQMATGYLALLEQIIQPNKLIRDMTVISATDRQQMLEFNQQLELVNNSESYGGIFRTTAKRFQNSVACISNDQSITYQELDTQSDMVALKLLDLGIATNDIVGVEVSRGLPMIVALLGVMKANAAYVPIDPHLPTQRKEYILEDSCAKALISDHPVDSFAGPVLNINQLRALPGALHDVYNIHRINNLIYTSGSTGKPKGVRILSSGINNLIAAAEKMQLFTADTTALSITTMTFDIFFFETFVPLMFGAKVVIANDDEITQAHLCADLIARYQINYLQTTPSRMKIMLESQTFRQSLGWIKLVILGGEEFQPSLREKLVQYTNARLINGYGPSETTVYSTMADVTTNPKVNIGKPLLNTFTYVLDQDLQLIPYNSIGELYIGGAGVSDGYHQRTELTNTRFINNPFNDGMMYKTGDLCRYQRNGELVYCGRNDNQVKIRGLRIELSEIENLLLEYSGIDLATVITAGQDEAKHLIAYYTSTNTIDEVTLRSFLSKQLPRYMVPTRFIQLTALPLTPGGKIDKLALKGFEQPLIRNQTSVEKPNKTQKQLISIWKKLLSIDNISIDESFFDLGGDSFGVMKFQVEALNHNWHFSTQDIYELLTIRNISSKIDNTYHSTDGKAKLNNIQQPLLSQIHQQPLKLNRVIITGATGYLGSHLAYELINHHQSDIVCLVRTVNGLDDLRKRWEFYFGAEDTTKMLQHTEIVTCDLTKRRFSLSLAQQQLLSSYRDGLYHCAALTSHYGDPKAFELNNVLVTKNMINWCLINSTPLIHMSTMSVAGRSNLNELTFTEQDSDIGQDYQFNVYVDSKFRAEQLVFKAIKQGMNARVHRLGTLCNRLDGKFQINPQANAFFNRLKTLVMTGAISELMVDNSCDFTAIDQCAKAILTLNQLPADEGYVYHIYNPNLITYSQLATILNNNTHPISIVGHEDFISHLKQISNQKNKYILTGIINELATNQLSVNTHTDCLATVRKLKQGNFEWEIPSESYIMKIID